MDSDLGAAPVASRSPDAVVGASTSHQAHRAVAVAIRDVTKRFGEEVVAVESMNLDIQDGEFFSLLGPSGCGKTTTLRMIAGLEFPTEGSLQIFGEEMGIRPPNKRPVNTVFQSYALFPHMNVFENVAFGLQMRKVDDTEIERKVDEAIELVHLRGMEKRKPRELSGGQQQRVALARALVNRPQVLLLDEPLGALDLKLRQAMQRELKDIQDNVGITFVYVTHDQEEALTMSDRIGVMREGRLAQVGTPEEIYRSPANLFVASFVGEASFLPGEVTQPGAVRLSGGEMVKVNTDLAAGTIVTLVLRPEMADIHAELSEVPSGSNAIGGRVTTTIFQGQSMLYEVAVGESGSFSVRVENLPGRRRWGIGDEVVVQFHPEAALALAQ
ncbi:MAG: ABC transporter ATP-binding protein [Acidimicrobiia bacterium]